MNLANLLYFHKKRVGIAIGFSTAYYFLLRSTVKHPSEAIRLGVAGSLANSICECGFHLVDTVNIRSKVAQDSSTGEAKSNGQFIREIYKKEGVYGFARGFSACFYGSIFQGFAFFFMYKSTKLALYDALGKDANPTLVYLLASAFAEAVTIMVHFPYDMIKCRL